MYKHTEYRIRIGGISMKRILFALLAAILCFSLCACGGDPKPEGKYKDALGATTLEFDGDTLTISTALTGEADSGEFEMDGDKIIIDGEEAMTYDAENDTINFMGLTYEKA